MRSRLEQVLHWGESGPFTTVEVTMLATVGGGRSLVSGYGWYNAVATLSGSVGALMAGGPPLLLDLLPGDVIDRRFFWSFVLVGALGVAIASRLSEAVEPTRSFAADHSGTVWTVPTLLARRIGLLNTMVWTHIPSNLCLRGLAIAPNLPVALACLVGRALLDQMDVPTRQAYVMALVDPSERTAAAAYTNTARYVARPWAALASAPLQALTGGAPFAVAGTVKTLYDLTLFRWFRRVPLPPAE